MTPPVLASRAVTKRFGTLVAVDDVDISLEAGSVHAIVGENGAGKSTLVSMLAGSVAPDTGSVVLDGSPVRFRSRTAAVRAGVALVPQHLSLIGDLTVIEHRLLAIGSAGREARRASERALGEAADAARVRLPFDVPTRTLPLPRRQLAELILALSLGARALLLDEPTSALGPVEVESLLTHVRHIATEGIAVALVTHRIDEVFGIADHITVLRAGTRIHSGPVDGASATEIATLMVGDDGPPPRTDRTPGDASSPRLVLEGVEVAPTEGPGLHDVGVVVGSGEVLGVAAVSGNGEAELVDAIAGLVPVAAGSLTLDDAHAVTAHIPRDRADGLVPTQSLADNAILFRAKERPFHRRGVIRRRHAARFTSGLAERYDVRPPHPERLTVALSGGNQQKLLVGRELERNPGVVVAHNPTRGLDPWATRRVHAALLEAAGGGAAVVLVTAALDELFRLSDRIVVLVAGRIAYEGPVAEATRELVGSAMAGLA